MKKVPGIIDGQAFNPGPSMIFNPDTHMDHWKNAGEPLLHNRIRRSSHSDTFDVALEAGP